MMEGTKRRTKASTNIQQRDRDSWKEEEEDKIPTYPRKDSGCIDPCPHFECILSKDICDTNCQRTMDNPCEICVHKGECTPKRRLILLRPDVIKFAQQRSSEKMGFITIDKFAERRVELVGKVNKLEDKIDTQKKIIEASVLPNFLAKRLYGKKSRKLQSLKTEAGFLLKEQKYYFDGVGLEDMSQKDKE